MSGCARRPCDEAVRFQAGKQNVTVSLRAETIQRAKILAARRSTSISALPERQIEALMGEEEDAYQNSRRSAFNLMDRGFHLGGAHPTPRDVLHER